MNGVVVVDKPTGCTSHDVVQRIRRAVGQRSVGHAGTLDPLATGVLVIALGEGTKLVSYLQAQSKEYEVTIALGTETDSLDADGAVTDEAPVPELDRLGVDAALQKFVGTLPQEAPRLSAIKVDGAPLHRRVRRGETVDAPVREVVLHQAEVVSVGAAEIVLRLHCGKGFYVRSLARDLARALGTLGHVARLRRTASGSFTLEGAVDGSAIDAEAVAAALLPLAEACRVLRRVALDAEGVRDARHGRRIDASSVHEDAWREAPPEETLALFAPSGEVVALGRREDDRIRIVRGFVDENLDEN